LFFDYVTSLIDPSTYFQVMSSINNIDLSILSSWSVDVWILKYFSIISCKLNDTINFSIFYKLYQVS